MTQPIEEIARDPAVGTVDIVVHRDDVDMAGHGAHRDRIVVDRQPVAEQQRVGIGLAQHALGHGVILLGDGAGEAPHRLDTFAAGPQLGRRRGVEQLVPRGDAIGRHEIGQEARPRAAVMVAQQFDPALLGVIACRLHRIEDEEGAAPPADLVVAEITDPVGAAAIRRNETGGKRAHRLLGRGIERIEPVKAGETTDLQVRHLG